MAGRPKNIESPDKLWEYFLKYKESVVKNPVLVHDFVGKDAEEVRREKQRPLTMEGFENWLEDNEIINDLGDYLANTDKRYSEFTTICSRIKRNIRQDQIEGGMTGIYNPSITQRLNGLTDKQDITTGGEKLQSSTPNIKVTIVKPLEEDE